MGKENLLILNTPPLPPPKSDASTVCVSSDNQIGLSVVLMILWLYGWLCT